MSFELSFTPMMFGCELSRPTVLGLDLDAREWRHAVEQHRNRRFVGDCGVVINECLLCNDVAIEVRSDNEHGIRARSSSIFYFIDRAERALLSGADDERKIAGCCSARCFDSLKVLALVEVNTLARGTEQHEATNTGLAPAIEVGTQRREVDLAAWRKRCGRRQENTVQVVPIKHLFSVLPLCPLCTQIAQIIPQAHLSNTRLPDIECLCELVEAM